VTPVIEVQVCKRQGDFAVDAAFRSERAAVTVLYGRSGAGKTSVIDMVAGLRRPDRGAIRLDGKTLFDSAQGIDLPPEQRRVGYIFQDGRLFPHLSIRGNLTYGMNLLPAGERRIGFDQVVDLLGISSLLSRRPGTLSGGEKQRVAIGRALLTSPRLLLMDEPLASLDQARKSEVIPFIGKLPTALSIPILYVTHSIDELVHLADDIVLLNCGRSVAVGKLQEVIGRPEFQEVIGRQEAFSVASMVVQAHEPSAGLTVLQGRNAVLRVPLITCPRGEPIRVRVRARDVALALSPPVNTSVQNILGGIIKGVDTIDASLVDVRLDVGFPLLARVTIKARHDLNLRVGQEIFALVKSVAISSGTLDDFDDRTCAPLNATARGNA
jgi:molybdate transport system ATP-binding protein